MKLSTELIKQNKTKQIHLGCAVDQLTLLCSKLNYYLHVHACQDRSRTSHPLPHNTYVAYIAV